MVDGEIWKEISDCGTFKSWLVWAYIRYTGVYRVSQSVAKARVCAKALMS